MIIQLGFLFFKKSVRGPSTLSQCVSFSFLGWRREDVLVIVTSLFSLFSTKMYLGNTPTDNCVSFKLEILFFFFCPLFLRVFWRKQPPSHFPPLFFCCCCFVSNPFPLTTSPLGKGKALFRLLHYTHCAHPSPRPTHCVTAHAPFVFSFFVP